MNDTYETGYYGDKKLHYKNMGRRVLNGGMVQQGMIIQITILGEPFHVLKATDNDFIVVGLYTGLVFTQERNGYYTLIKGEIVPEKMRNVKSQVSHLMYGGKSGCGTVGDFSDLISTDKVTCLHCLENK